MTTTLRIHSLLLASCGSTSAGVLGVTFFGLLLTPVFFVAIESFLARSKRDPQPVPHLALEAQA